MASAFVGSAPARLVQQRKTATRSRAGLNAIVCSSQADKAPQQAELGRRDAITLAASAAAGALGFDAPADASTGPLGLRKSGNGGVRKIPESEYTTLPSGVKYYDMTARKDPTRKPSRPGWGGLHPALIPAREAFTSRVCPVGSGAAPAKGDRVAVHFDCKFRSLTVATSRQGAGVTGGVPYGFNVGVKAGTPGGPFIEGMNEGILGMRVGGQRKLIIPPAYAYGNLQVQEIPPNATLNFDLELLSIGKESPFKKKA